MRSRAYVVVFFFLFKQKTAYEMRISDWSSDVCSSDLHSDPADGGDGGLCRGDDRAAAQRDVGEPRSRGPARRPRRAANAPPLRELLVLLKGNDVWIYATTDRKSVV